MLWCRFGPVFPRGLKRQRRRLRPENTRVQNISWRRCGKGAFGEAFPFHSLGKHRTQELIPSYFSYFILYFTCDWGDLLLCGEQRGSGRLARCSGRGEVHQKVGAAPRSFTRDETRAARGPLAASGGKEHRTSVSPSLPSNIIGLRRVGAEAPATPPERTGANEAWQPTGSLLIDLPAV